MSRIGLWLTAAAAWPVLAVAADYPTKPIRMIVAVPPGGPADTLARMVAPRLTESLGQTVVIDNRPGANGNIAYEMGARAAPDGYTFTLAAAGVAINPSLYREVRFDPVKDFTGITHGISVPNILVVHPSVAATSVKELIALGKAKPVNFASAGNGSSGHLAVEQFKIVSGSGWISGRNRTNRAGFLRDARVIGGVTRRQTYVHARCGGLWRRSAAPNPPYGFLRRKFF